MIRSIVNTAGTALLALTLACCHSHTSTPTIKLSANDPFKNTIVPNQVFQVDSREDHVIEGTQGTIIVLPKGCFKNEHGDIVEDTVKIELAEALTLQDMLLSNLTTTADGKLLETDGMIYFNATANGKQLTINKDLPVHIEIPTDQKKPGMKAYKGTRDEHGHMNWTNPQPLNHYLVTIDIDLLDFLPQGFQAAVESSMPLRNHQVATKAFTDSLYYSLAVSDYLELSRPAAYDMEYFEEDEIHEDSTIPAFTDWGIDPSIIKTINSKKYQHTFIATREFETRLKTIFRTCNDDIIEIYINNLDKNLYEADSLAALLCNEKKYQQCQKIFHAFSQQHLTNVRQANRYAALLRGYYEKQLAEVKSALTKEKEKLAKELKKKNEKAQKMLDDYEQLLWKREKYRMETYGFEWTETGWINIDNGTLPNDWYNRPLEIWVENGQQFDQVYTYVVYTSIKSLCRLNTTNHEQFYAGNENDKRMIMPRQKKGVAIAIGYQNEVPSLAIREFETGSDSAFTLTLSPSTPSKIKESVKAYEKYGKENQIMKDLEYMKFFYEEERRQIQRMQERELKLRLWSIAFPRCTDFDTVAR